MRKKCVVMIAFSDVAYDARTQNMARALLDDGCDVTIISSGMLPEHLEGVNHIQWHKPRNRVLFQWLRFRRFVRNCEPGLNLVGTKCVVMAMDFFSLHAAAHVAKRYQGRLVYDMRELYFATGPLGGKGLRQTLITRMERALVRRVHRIVVSAPLDAEVVYDFYTLRHMPDVVLNTPPYRDAIDDSPLRNECRVKPTDTVLLYQGVVLHGRGIRPTLDAMVGQSHIHFAIIGDGAARPELEAYAREIGVHKNVHWLGMKPYGELHEWTCGADIGMCVIEPVSLSYEYALPNKFFEYMMARIPSICSDIIALHQMVMKHPVGMLVDKALRPADILRAISRLTIPATREAMIEQCEAIVHYSYETQVHIVQDIVRSEGGW